MSQKQTTKKGNVNAVNETVIVTEKIGKDATTEKSYPFSAKNLPADLAAILKSIDRSGSFRFQGHLFKFPALSVGNTNFERAVSVFKQIISKAFPNEAESTDIITEKNPFFPAVMSMQKFAKFSQPNKKQVVTAFRIWEGNRKEKNRAAIEIVRNLNARTIAETEALKKATKVVREDTAKQITGFSAEFGKIKLLNSDKI